VRDGEGPESLGFGRKHLSTKTRN